MAVPTHKPDCKTLIWKTNCQFCEETVFYFSCTCGSRVFFNEPQWPWPLHSTTCNGYRVFKLIEEGTSPTDLRRVLESEARKFGVELTKDVETALRYWEDRLIKNKSPIIEDVLPSEEPVEFEAEYLGHDQVNFFRRLLLEKSPLSEKILGSLLDKPYVEVRVRETKARGSIVRQYKFFAKKEDIDVLRLRVGDSIYCLLKLLEIPSIERAFWIVVDIDNK